ncbi:hypothetical protein [Amycolatopsis kentuckyensis]|uniref:hypothetical protein n=1 Tax=Amycolatopsis kentuckyensis TaxID=218823 RepID=UPI003567564C
MTPAPAPPEPWYTSALFWTIAGVAVAILAIVVSGFVTWWVANPKRRLYVYAANITPLVHRAGAILSLEVRSDGVVLTNPHVVTVHISVRSRRDIRKDAFDGPIKLFFGAHIVDVLEQIHQSDVPGSPWPKLVQHKDFLEVQPSLLRRDAKLTYTVLVEGDKAPSFWSEVPVDADIREKGPAEATVLEGVAIKIATRVAVGSARPWVTKR